MTKVGRRLRRNMSLLVGVCLVVAWVGAAVFGPRFVSHGYDDQSLRDRLRPPVWLEGGVSAHPLGTDSLGRDLLTRIVYGARISLLISFGGVLIGAGIGVTLGLITGYFGGWFDNTVMRIADVQLAFPYLLLAIAVVAALGPSVTNLMLVLGLRTWVVYARTVRGTVLTTKGLEYVQAALAIGSSSGRAIVRHVLPNIAGPILVLATAELAQLILMEATLSFLGLGVQPPFPSWGTMLSAGREYLGSAWWLATFPGLAILLAVFGVNLVGDGMRDALDKSS